MSLSTCFSNWVNQSIEQSFRRVDSEATRYMLTQKDEIYTLTKIGLYSTIAGIGLGIASCKAHRNSPAKCLASNFSVILIITGIACSALSIFGIYNLGKNFG